MSFSLGYRGLEIAQAEPEQVFERRTYQRFELVSPVLFQRADPAGSYEIGFCTNLGLGGVFIVTTECPVTGTHVCLEVLVRASKPTGSQLWLKGTGDVVRIQTGDQLCGFAVAGRFENQVVRKRMQIGT
jgi:hypothetical protein